MKLHQYSHRRKMRSVKRGYTDQSETHFPDKIRCSKAETQARRIGFQKEVV